MLHSQPFGSGAIKRSSLAVISGLSWPIKSFGKLTATKIIRALSRSRTILDFCTSTDLQEIWLVRMLILWTIFLRMSRSTLILVLPSRLEFSL